MSRFVLAAMTAAGVVLGLASAGPAAAAMPAATMPLASAQPTGITQIDYYYNHHHYKHRSWDKHHKRWHYY